MVNVHPIFHEEFIEELSLGRNSLDSTLLIEKDINEWLEEEEGECIHVFMVRSSCCGGEWR